MLNKIIIKGAREHNLKNISLEIPKNKLVVFTGVSGSGKSSLAFDTIYAEGQRRYVESLSSYARQFLGVMAKPEVELIEGLSPSISIDQKSVSGNPRSTVGTITEIYDYFRLLYARIGHPYCPRCSLEIAKSSPEEIVSKIFLTINNSFAEDKIEPKKFTITSPIVIEKKGEFLSLFDNLKAKGFDKVVIDKKLFSLNEDIVLIKTNKHTIEVIIDVFSLTFKNYRDSLFKAQLKSRLFESVETGLNLSNGLIALEESSEKHIFSEKFSCPNCNISLPEIEPRMFSFNSPLGACQTCKGLGFISNIDPLLVLNKNLSINQGGIIPFGKIYQQTTWFSRVFKTFLEDNNISASVILTALNDKQLNKLLHGEDKIYKVKGKNRFGHDTFIFEKFEGVIGELKKRYKETESDFIRKELEKYMREEVCSSCQGKRLKKEVLSVKIFKKDIYQLSEQSIAALGDYFENLPNKLSAYEKEISQPIIAEIKNRLSFLNSVGLSYLTINRTARTLSGGESQRIRLASQVGSGLTGVIYVLDEPSIGLHPKDVNALINNLKKLKDLGNTIIIVEHDFETIAAADYIVDFGPLAGAAGGKIVFAGKYEELKREKKSLTGQYLFRKKNINAENGLKPFPATKQGSLLIIGCQQNNLKGIKVSFPLGNLICVTGVSGSGKSTLIVETLYPALKYYLGSDQKQFIGKFERLEGHQYLDNVYLVDQSPIGRTPRSNPVTYVGAFDFIRDLFAQTADAKIKGYKKGRFSFNVKGGRCEKCGGAGTIKIEMQFLPDIYVKCDLCDGKRYNSQTLEIKYKGVNIYEVLNFTVDEACDFFKNHPLIFNKLKTLKDVGLGYIELGQPAPTLSGGEAQRIKLAYELAKKETGRTLYVLDEPTTGLHLYDIEKLLTALYKLIEKGNTVIIIEHNMEIIRNCHYIIDLGPEGGDHGGEVIYQGPMKQITSIKNSYTGWYLNKCLS